MEKIFRRCFVGLLLVGLAGFMAGCGGNGTSIWDGGGEELIITDTTPPTVISTNPINGATNVPLNSKITATFSEVMDPATIVSPATTFTVTGPGSTPVSGTVSYSDTTALFTPDSDLSDTTLYTATITTAAQDDIGNALASNYVWTFTTGVTTDETLPWITITDPADGDTNVAPNQKITAIFSEVMDPTTIDTTTFTLIGPSGVVSGRVEYAGTTAVFTPIDSLEADTNLAAGVYTALITVGAKDLAGNALDVPQISPVPDSWSFTVGTTPDNTAPTITFTDPVDDTEGDTPVAINHAVSATFSEPMNPATIIAGVTFIVNEFDTGDTVLGTIAFVTNADTTIATFTPDSDLLENTHYIATITNMVEDLDGDTLVVPQITPVPDPWNFWTGTDTELAQGAIDLGSAGAFGIVARDSISNSGAATMINGDVALREGTDHTGLTPAMVNGTIYVNDVPVAGVALQAQTDLTAAFIFGRDLPPGIDTPTSDLGLWAGPVDNPYGAGTLPPGTYTSGSSMEIDTPLTLNAGGNPKAVWVFQMPSSTLTTATTTGNVLLAGGAQAKNVFWIVGSSATIGGTGTTFNGNVLASIDISVGTDVTINGRLLSGASGAGAITLLNNTVNVPAP
ncbi:MAG: Ig-like domain-containing protein [Candidatus Ratteibacteria bacterium]|jgi:hypothetical protein